MTQYTKPTVLPAWGESAGGADVLQPTDAEIQAGWPLSNVPPSRKRFNWILKYLAQGVRYMMQMGIPVWDSTEDYPVNARVMGSDGKTYKAILTGINKDPTTQPTYWTRWGFTLAELNAEGTTPPQFDNATSLATTAFVQRALGSRQGYNVPATGSSFSAADAGKAFGLNGSSTYTLSSASGLPNGATFDFFAAGNGCVVQASGSDTITIKGGATVTSLTLNSGDTLSLVRVGPTAWLAISGSAQLKFADVFDSSIAASGYQKLPSGLIIQWGELTLGSWTASATPSITAITFPVAFSLGCYSVVANPTVGATTFGITAESQSKTGFFLRYYNNASAVTWLAIRWIALGK